MSALKKEFSLKQLKAIVLITLTVWGFVIYLNSLHGSLQYDDTRQILENPFLKNPTQIFLIWKNSGVRFIPYYTFSLQLALTGTKTFPFHLFNIFIHIASSWLVFLLSLILLQKSQTVRANASPKTIFIPFLSALLFLTHPVQTQAVSYIVQRITSIATLFYLLTLYFYARYKLKGGKNYFWMGITSTVAAMLSKEIAFTLPFALLAFEMLILKSSLKNAAWSLIPFWLTLPIVPALVLSHSASDLKMGLIPVETLSVGRFEYFVTELNAVRDYLILTLFPFKQSIEHNYPITYHFLNFPTISSALFLTGLVALVLKLRKAMPIVSFGVIWFLLALSVESSFIPIREAFVEHRLYLPMFGFVLVLPQILNRAIKNTRACSIVLILIICLWSFLTYKRNFVWQSPLTLWSDAAKKFPNSVKARMNFANALYQNHQLEEAVHELTQITEMSAQLAEPHNTLGIIYSDQKKYDIAEKEFLRAIAINPKYSEAYYNLAMSYRESGKKLGEWEQYIKKSIALNPRFVEAFFSLGTHYAEQCELKKAADFFKQALAANPHHLLSLKIKAQLENIQPAPNESWETKEKQCKLMNDLKWLTELNKLKSIPKIPKVYKIYTQY